MELVLDEISFSPEYISAFDKTVEKLATAGRESTEDAAIRAEEAQFDLDDLKRFKSEVARHLRAGSFASLPALRTGLRRIPNCHYLRVGPWKGIFLVEAGGRDLVVGLVFSKAPHDFADKISELVTKHGRSKSLPSDDGGVQE